MRKVPKPQPKPKQSRVSVVDPETGEILIPWDSMEDKLKEAGLI